MDGAERLAYYKKLKKEKRAAQNKANYQKKREEILQKQRARYAEKRDAEKKDARNRRGRPSMEEIRNDAKKAKKREQNAWYRAKCKAQQASHWKKMLLNRQRVARHRAEQREAKENVSAGAVV